MQFLFPFFVILQCCVKQWLPTSNIWFSMQMIKLKRNFWIVRVHYLHYLFLQLVVPSSSWRDLFIFRLMTWVSLLVSVASFWFPSVAISKKWSKYEAVDSIFLMFLRGTAICRIKFIINNVGPLHLQNNNLQGIWFIWGLKVRLTNFFHFLIIFTSIFCLFVFFLLICR